MDTMFLGIKLLRPTIIDASILFLAVVSVVVSLCLATQFPNAELFERSGSLVVLFAVIVEFRNSKIQQKINDKAATTMVGFSSIAIATKQPPIRQFIIISAHTFIASGTLIWGYGGLLK